MHVVDDAEWQTFICLAVSIYVKEEKRHASVLSSVYTAHGALQRYLNSFPAAVVAGLLFDKCGPGMRADVLMDLLVALDDQKAAVQDRVRAAGVGQDTASSSAGWSNNAGLRMVSSDDKLDETQRRERTVLQTDAQSLQNDLVGSKVLRDLQIGLQGDEKEAAAGEVLAACSRDVRLHRLLLSGEQIQPALAGNCAQELETCVMGIRSIMARRHERFVTAGSNNVCSDLQAKALAAIRLGRMRNVKLLNLLDMPDKSTKASPLEGFVDVHDGDVCIQVAIGLLASAWSYVQVADTASIAIFCNTLAEVIRKARGDGVRWVKTDAETYGLSQFMASVWRKVDMNTESMMVAESVRPRGAPQITWLQDGTYEWVRDLASARGSAAAVAAAEKTTNRLLAEARKQSEGGTKARQTRSGGGGGGGNANEPPAKKTKTKKKKAAKGSPGAAASTAAPAAAPAAATESPSELRRRVQTELKAKYGQKDGKDPCFFFLHNGVCNYTADNCKFHHG